MKEAAIELRSVSKIFKGKKAVDNLSLSVEKGSVVALLGPNGAGKTTTVSLILGLLQPTSGTVKLLGGDPQNRKVRDRIGAMLQDVSVIDSLTVAETINLFRHYYEKPLPLEQLLTISGLKEERNKMATSLSGGQKRRLGFAMAAAGDPEVLFLDEPTVGMDVTSRQLFWDTVKAMADNGRTIVLTTHYLEEADQIANRIIVINGGRLIADGTPSEVKASAIGRTITFTAGEGVTDASLQAVPGIAKTEWSGSRVRLFSGDTDRLIVELVQRGVTMKDIEIQSGGLEEAFRTLVSSSHEQ